MRTGGALNNFRSNLLKRSYCSPFIWLDQPHILLTELHQLISELLIRNFLIAEQDYQLPSFCHYLLPIPVPPRHFSLFHPPFYRSHGFNTVGEISPHPSHLASVGRKIQLKV